MKNISTHSNIFPSCSSFQVLRHGEETSIVNRIKVLEAFETERHACKWRDKNFLYCFNCHPRQNFASFRTQKALLNPFCGQGTLNSFALWLWNCFHECARKEKRNVSRNRWWWSHVAIQTKFMIHLWRFMVNSCQTPTAVKNLNLFKMINIEKVVNSICNWAER